MANVLGIGWSHHAKHRAIWHPDNLYRIAEALRVGYTAGVLSVVAMILLGPFFPAVAAAQVQQPQKFLTFDYHMKPEQIGASPNRYVFVWGDSASMTSALVKYSPSSLLSAYFPYARDPDANHDFTYWKARHPTWVTYRCDGVTPAYFAGDANVPLDISNPDVVVWQATQFAHLRPGLHAVALDNFQFQNKLGVCGVHDASGRFVRKYSGKLDDMAFATDTVRWLEKISAALHEQHIDVVINHIPDLTPDGDDPESLLVQRMVGAVDGIVDEHAQEALQSAPKGALLASFVDYLQSRDKWMYLIYQYQGNSPQLAESAMANYLTMAGPKSAIYIPVKDTVSGQEPNFYGFDRQIGEPCGPAIMRNGVYSKNFAQGMAIYAPAGRISGSLVVPSGYQTVDGSEAGVEQHLTGGQGRVLYASSSNVCAHH